MKLPALKKSYRNRCVLDLPELELESGKIYAVIGANGSGKSTMAKLLSGTEACDGGKQLCLPCDVRYMPQVSFAFRMSTRRNILLGGDSPEKCEKLMRELKIDHLADTGAKKLSGGETARMALARLMMRSCSLAVLDEPTAAMDIEATLLSERMMTGYCRESGCAMLLITHSLQQARRIADRILYLEDGRLIEAGEKEQVLSSPVSESTRRFLDFYGLQV